MRVLHFYKTYFPESVGGVEQVIRQMCVGTGRLGVRNEVLTLTRQKEKRDVDFEGHKVRLLPLDFEISSTGFSLAAFGELARMAEDADVVHYHFPWPFMDLAHFISRIKKPSLVTYHSDIVRQKQLLRLYQPLKHRFLQSVDTIVATSPNYMASSAVLDRYRDKTRVITYGLDKTIYPEPDQARMDKWRARIGERFFLFVGVLRYYKGLHILLDAVANTDYPVVIVGAGPIETELKAHAERLGLTHVLFVGALDEADKVALLTLCYALVFPSHLRSEAFGISLLEGAMYGKPMISSEIGTGTTYINIDAETGLVVPPSDPQAFGDAMRTLWDNPELAQAMGKRAEARYWELFTAEQMAKSYTALYHELVANHATVALAQVQA
ncbi:glycosyltransferase family 4 protein [Massilia antarctica]|uniref:glycosyltransferase family 4 protein n=1 Tax=Massilia antarctica TaxID=2765360 RepID=UPI0006BB98BF|nr:glycosyltransferase family 4 protein [Massilia sp. H27-R4]MCY0913400.1 glycosyltransferase family 4 protein [Massilia sp. H27-R4]CUI09532.1 Glycosyltransferase [Janthinobacterium sp. CG23_2]CUU33318.1 Glycosyltransferase [Janthinobacterium sp. CG23_2]